MTHNSTVPFHRKGVAYFWIFNDRCEWDIAERQLQAFASQENILALCLHPRFGLLLPYGGDEWFDFIRKVCRCAAELGLQIWLYDEDPFPSGNAGGRIVVEHPDLIARGIQIFTYDPDAQGDTSLFCFPTGPLIWCGLVDEKTSEVVDLTTRVGVLRRKWLEPTAQWCRNHNLKLVGHISPEDDPTEQAICVGNLLPLMKEFDLCGIDIIIPALGDHRHPILSVGVTCATSIAQQQKKQGVMTETGAFSHSISPEGIGKILLWQSIMGVTAPLIHCAFSSTRGPREYEKPDFGPDGRFWPYMGEIRERIVAVQEYTHGARQIAPVAILWPIRSFNVERFVSNQDHTGLRRELTGLLSACLDRQVGTHFIDEADLPGLTVRNGQAILGMARYTHIVIPSCSVLLARTIEELRRLRSEGIEVILSGRVPTMQQTDGTVEPVDMSWCPQMIPEETVTSLPRLIELEDDATGIRCTAWESSKVGGKTVRLLMNIGTESYQAKFDGRTLILEPGVVHVVW